LPFFAFSYSFLLFLALLLSFRQLNKELHFDATVDKGKSLCRKLAFRAEFTENTKADKIFVLFRVFRDIRGSKNLC